MIQHQSRTQKSEKKYDAWQLTEKKSDNNKSRKTSKLREPSKSVLTKYDFPFLKHITGIEPIIESEANFEQTQKVEFGPGLRRNQ